MRIRSVAAAVIAIIDGRESKYLIFFFIYSIKRRIGDGSLCVLTHANCHIYFF